MKKINIQMTTLSTDNEQTGVSPRVASLGTTSTRPYMEFSKIARALFMLNITAIAGTSPTFDLKIEGRDETAGVWRTVATFPQQSTVNTPAPIEVNPLYYTILRATWTVGGTATPSFTFTLSALALGD